MRVLLSKLRRFVESRRRIVTPLVFLVIAVSLVAHGLATPIEDMGPDGQTYEQLGYETALSGNILAC